MNVSITKELEAYVKSRVESGLYNNSSEVVREGLRLLQERDEIHSVKLKALREMVQAGIDSMERGEVSDGETAMRKIRDELKVGAR